MGFSLKSLAPIVGGGAGFLLGGPAGAALGAGLGSVFSSGGGLGGSKGGFESQQYSRWNPKQQELFNQMYGVASPQLGKGLTPTPEETAYGSFLKNYEPWYRNLADTTFSPEATKNYYRDVVYPEFEQKALPGITRAYGGPGYWGSARAKAVSDAYAGIGRQEAVDLYGNEQKHQAAIMALGEKLPVTQQTLANWSRAFTPEQSPYLQMAMQMLGLQPLIPSQHTVTLAGLRRGYSRGSWRRAGEDGAGSTQHDGRQVKHVW